MSAPTIGAPAVGRDRGFHVLRVARVVAETDDAASIVLEVPEALRGTFAYDPGQFCTFRVVVDGVAHLRCYSMSSTPGVDPELAVTVKRVPDGLVSNRLLDTVTAGATVELTAPAGVFRLDPADEELVAFAAGSGITPVFSLLKAALATTPRPVRLLYANRDAASVIFAAALDRLRVEHGGRLEVEHHLDVERGFVDAAAVRAFVGDRVPSGAGFYLCGPAPFMEIVEEALLDDGVDPDRIHLERFTPVDADAPTAAAAGGDHGEGVEAAARVTVEVEGRVASTEHRSGTTLLQAARQLGMSPPFSCESGSCATCMARLVEGTAAMRVNDALTDDEVAQGWVLTCQAVPTSPTVHVVYGFD